MARSNEIKREGGKYHTMATMGGGESDEVEIEGGGEGEEKVWKGSDGEAWAWDWAAARIELGWFWLGCQGDA